jgi:hypothetical protein
MAHGRTARGIGLLVMVALAACTFDGRGSIPVSVDMLPDAAADEPPGRVDEPLARHEDAPAPPPAVEPADASDDVPEDEAAPEGPLDALPEAATDLVDGADAGEDAGPPDTDAGADADPDLAATGDGGATGQACDGDAGACDPGCPGCVP